MKHIGLFEGIGGFSLAAQWVGWETIAWCEINEFCQTILRYHFPNAKEHHDIRETDFTIYRGKCDVLTGGFPCQPFSVAGKQLGTEDERHLWPEMLRAIREISPRWIVGENVRGLINWNGGLVFDQVQADLEVEGYQVLPFLLPACGVNAPHRRDRIWFIAYAPGDRFQRWSDSRELRNERANRKQRFENMGLIPRSNWQNFPTQSPVCSGNDGLSARLDGITFSKWRAESIAAAGNAIVPQVAYEIFKVIETMESK